MTKSLRAKTTAGIGLLSILLGAFMVFAPAASSAENPTVEPYSGNPSCFTFGYDFELKDNSVTTGGASETIADEDVSVTYSTRIEDVDGTPTLFIDWTAEAVTDGETALILAVLVKQGDGGAAFTYNPGATSGTVYVIPAGNSSATGISHLSFCHDGSTVTSTSTSEATTSTEPDSDPTTTTSTTQATTTTIEDTTTTTEEEVLSTTSTMGETTTTEGDTTTTEAEEVDSTSSTQAAAQADPQVLDNSVSGAAALPKTGSGTDRMAAIGAALMILGAILVGGSRRSLTQR